MRIDGISGRAGGYCEPCPTPREPFTFRKPSDPYGWKANPGTSPFEALSPEEGARILVASPKLAAARATKAPTTRRTSAAPKAEPRAKKVRLLVDDSRIIELLNAGHSRQATADKLGVTMYRVTLIARRDGIGRQLPGPPKGQLKQATIERLENAALDDYRAGMSVVKIARKHGVPWRSAKLYLASQGVIFDTGQDLKPRAHKKGQS